LRDVAQEAVDIGDGEGAVFVNAQAAKLEALETAARDFIAKVDAGNARSTRTYAALKAALDMVPPPLPRATDVPDATRAMTARIVAERVRQQTDEGRTPDWDDRHTTGGLARAAACYALAAGAARDYVNRFWPWGTKAWKPADPMRNLEKAGALILAEMERLARS
jgi:hypothetical protein